MSRALVRLTSKREREKAAHWCMTAPAGTSVEFKEAGSRTLEQNSRLWAMLTDVASQVEWPPTSGMRLSAEDWKLIFLDSLTQEMRLVPNARLNGYINLGRSSSKLSKREFTDLIELIFEFGARYSVKFHEPAETEAA